MKTALGILFVVSFSSALNLDFQAKHRYTFRYQTQILHSNPGGANKQIGLRLQCDCHVTILKRDEPAEAQIKIENIQLQQLEIGQQNQSREFPINADPKAIDLLQKNPIELIFSQSGRVKTIRYNSQEPVWCLNIKRGIANMLQVAPKVEHQKKVFKTNQPLVVMQKEQTIVGNCPVTYTVEPWEQEDNKTKGLAKVTKVTKTLDYKNCADRPSMTESIVMGQLCPSCQKSLGYVPFLRHSGQMEHILQNRFLTEARADEVHTITPFSELGGKIEVHVRQTLKFQSQRSQPTIEVLRNSAETTLKMQLVHPVHEMKELKQFQKGLQMKIMQQQQNLANEVNRDISSHRIPQIVSQLTVHLRMCGTDALKQFLDATVKHPNQQVRNLCADAIGLAANRELAQLLNDMVKQKRAFKIPREILNRVLTNIVFIPEVTVQHVDAVLNICQNAQQLRGNDQQQSRQQCYISLGALLNPLVQRKDAQQRADIQTTIRICVEHMRQQLNQAQTVNERLGMLKAMGNAGNSGHQQVILRFLQDDSQQTVVRVECVWALRRLVHRQHRDALTAKLIEIFHDRNQDHELRMAIVELLLDRQPTFLNMQMFLNAVIKEVNSQGPRSNQVASWVISKLSSMAYYDNIILKDRATRARRCLSYFRRQVIRLNYGIQFSKAMRIAMYSNKLQAGLELELNKMNVPNTYIPRNMNGRLLMHFMGNKFEVLQAGVRVEGLEKIVEDLTSEIRSRHRRSIWSSVWEFFSSQLPTPTPSDPKNQSHPTDFPTDKDEASSDWEESEYTENPTSYKTEQQTQKSTQKSTGSQKSARSQKPTASQKSTRSQKPTTSQNNQVNARKTEFAMFMKVFGQEVKYTRITSDVIGQIADQISDLVLQKKKEIQTALGAISITKKSISITQGITKALLAAHTRHLEPTICGLPLHRHLIATAVTKMDATLTAKAEPNLFQLMNADELKLTMDVKPKISVFTTDTLHVHLSPFVRVGLRSQQVVQLRPNMDFTYDAKFGKSQVFKMGTPKQQTDVLVVSPDPDNDKEQGLCGFVDTLKVDDYKVDRQKVNLQLSKYYMTEVQETCYGETFGVGACVQGRLPSLSTLRFNDVPVFPYLSMTNLRLRIVPKDNARNIEIQINSGNEIVFRVNADKKREMVVKYKQQQDRLVFRVERITGLPQFLGKSDVKIFYQNGRTMVAVVKNGNYEWIMTGNIDQYGRLLKLKFKWNKLPRTLKRILRQYEPKIRYFLQNIATISSQEQQSNNRGKQLKSLEIAFQLLGPFAAKLFIESPEIKVESKVMSLPVSMRRLPLSFKEILQWPYGQCCIQSQRLTGQKRISIFDRKSFSFSGPRSQCRQHTLLQDKKQKLVRIAVQSQGNGQMDLVAQISHPNQLTIVFRKDGSILVNKRKVSLQTIRLPGVQITRNQNKIALTLTSKYYLRVTYQPSEVKIRASPFLRDQVRGLCGDNNGEEYQELRSPDNKILSNTDDFVRSWRSQC